MKDIIRIQNKLDTVICVVTKYPCSHKNVYSHLRNDNRTDLTN